MGKKRSIDSKIRSSQSFALLDYRQRDLWQGLIEVADDQGRMPGLPAYIRSSVWPFDDVKLSDVDSDLDSLEDIGYLVRYVVGSKLYLQIVNWWKYQSMQWAGPSDCPPPPGWMDKLRYHGKGNEIITLNWDTEGGFDALPSPLPSKVPIPQASDFPSRDVKGEVNDEVNDDDEGEDDLEIITAAATTANIQPFGQLYDAFLEATKIAPTMLNEHKAADTIREWVAAKITPQEVTQAITEMQQKGLTIVGPWSVTNGINIVRSKGKGKQSADRTSEAARKRYAEWDKVGK